MLNLGPLAYSSVFGEGKDVEPLDENGSVGDDDIIKYDHPTRGGHATLVIDVVDDDPCEGTHKPSELRWKWLASAIYKCEPPEGNEFDTPMKPGPVDPAKEISEQGWVWDVEYMPIWCGEVFH